jgi:hypothetical protein
MEYQPSLWDLNRGISYFDGQIIPFCDNFEVTYVFNTFKYYVSCPDMKISVRIFDFCYLQERKQLVSGTTVEKIGNKINNSHLCLFIIDISVVMHNAR